MSSDSDLELLNMIVNSDSDNEFFDMGRQVLTILPEMEAAEQREREESSSQPPRRRRRVVQRDREGANTLLMEHYFNDSHIYLDNQFDRRYRMTRNMFERIINGIRNFVSDPLPSHFQWFRVGRDAMNRDPISIYQKCTAAVRQLAYGIAGDATDEYLQMGETTALASLDNFCKCVYDLYSNVYLRKPTTQDIQRLYAKHEEVHGLPGMLGSIDCMHWAWRNCPTAWKGQYTRGDHGHPTIMLEAVASYDLWIWHAFFGVAGSNNDINVLQQSTLFHDLVNDTAPPSKFKIGPNEYEHGYYLADGIYPEWAAFVKSYSAPQDDKRRKFKRVQESARKDVERAFGVLQGKWEILKRPARSWSENKISRIMYTCIILHNMVVEENGYAISAPQPYYHHPTNISQRTFTQICEARIQNNQRLRSRETHHNLRQELTEHVWRNNNI